MQTSAALIVALLTGVSPDARPGEPTGVGFAPRLLLADSLIADARYTGGTVPDDMHIEQRPFRGLWVAGLSTFLLAYVPAAVINGVLGNWRMTIPVYGQAVALAQGQAALNAVLLGADAVAEVAGLALFVTGLCLKTPYLVRDKLDDWRFTLLPTGLGVGFVAQH